MKDLQGREYAKLCELKEGDEILIDGDFTCAGPWTKHKVHRNGHGLYFKCREGEHYLEGQADNGDDCIGVYHCYERV